MNLSLKTVIRLSALLSVLAGVCTLVFLRIDPSPVVHAQTPPAPAAAQAPAAPAQAAAAPATAVKTPDQLVDQWFVRLNELDDWRISMDGKEPNEALVDRFVDLYSPDAYFQVGPGENQMGPIVYAGHDGIRKWANSFSKSFVDLNYRVEYLTRQGKTAQLVFAIQPPWGGTGAAVEVSGVYTNRRNRDKFAAPGAAFFIFDDTGKIKNLRLYTQTDELKKIE